MPRPSLKEERTAEILDAYGRCIARHGVDGTTLDMTADEAGMARALIRHNVGNKDDILDAFLDRFLATSSSEVDELFDALPGDQRTATMINWLFDPGYASSDSASVSNALFAAASTRPVLARRLQKWTEAFTNRIADELRKEYPPSADMAETVAAGIVAIYFSFDALASLGGARKSQKKYAAAARLLVSALAGNR